MAAMKNLKTEAEETTRCSDYYGCQGCPVVEYCEACAETDECEVGE
jgi:hypothetical protein